MMTNGLSRHSGEVRWRQWTCTPQPAMELAKSAQYGRYRKAVIDFVRDRRTSEKTQRLVQSLSCVGPATALTKTPAGHQAGGTWQRRGFRPMQLRSDSLPKHPVVPTTDPCSLSSAHAANKTFSALVGGRFTAGVGTTEGHDKQHPRMRPPATAGAVGSSRPARWLRPARRSTGKNLRTGWPLLPSTLKMVGAATLKNTQYQRRPG
jgi:hypothetical protein